MRIQISFHNLEPASHEGLERTIESLAARHLEQYLARFDPALVELKVNVDKANDRNFYRLNMHLAIPGTVLPVREEGLDLGAMLNQSMDRMQSELARHVSRLKED